MKKRIVEFSPAKLLLAWLILLAATATTQTLEASCTPPPAGIVGWLPAEGNANDIIGGDNGTLEGGATFAPGEVGLGFRFDGTNGYVQIPDSAALKPANVTVEAWIWLDPNVSPSSNEQIIFKQNSWSYYFEGYTILKAHIDNGNGTFTDHFQSVVSANGNQIAINSITAVQRGVWYHVATTYDGNQLTLYVNGVAEASAIAGFPLDYGTEPVFIGTTGVPGVYINMFAGIIDEASIYNRALASNEIAAIYNAGSAGKCTTASLAVPVISSLSPSSGANGTVVTISGNNFSPTPAANIVYFGAVQAVVSSASPTNLVVTVPVGATFAPVNVTVNGLTASSSQFFGPTFTGDGSSISSTSFSNSFTLGTSYGSTSVVIADLDGDGKPDIALVNQGYVSIFRNISTNGEPLNAACFAPRVDLPYSANAYKLRAVDLDGDGKLDLIACETGGSNITIFHNISTPGSLTTNSFEAGFKLPTGNDCRHAMAVDLDGDGHLDIVALNYGDSTISIFRNIGAAGSLTTNSFSPPVTLACPGGPYEAVAADLDGDGRPDLAVVNGDNNTVSIFQNVAVPGVLNTNSFATRIDLPADSNPTTIAAVDLDGDGKLDLVVGLVHSSNTSIYQNISAGGGLLTANSFAPRVNFSTPYWGFTVAVADFNGDGKPDITEVGQLPSTMSVFQNTSSPGSITSASLGPRVDFGTGWNATGVAAGDLNGDGRPDIVFCNYYDSNIQIYQNVMPFGTAPTAPIIVSQPTNLTVTVNATAVFTVAANGTAPLNYQWNYYGTNIVGATNATLMLNNVQLTQTGNYSVTVSNIVGLAASSNAVLTVVIPPTPPTILSQTPNQVVLLGSTATFSVSVSGADPLIYFWSRNGALVPGATNSSYTLNNAQLSDSGSQFSCLVTNTYGSANSTNASLKVINSTVANDLCSGAIVITSGSYTNVQSTVQATSFGDPVPDCVDGFGHGVWYQFIAPVTGQLVVDTFGSDFDTGLAIYTGSCDALMEVVCNDDTGGVTSQVTVPTTAGTTYFIIAGGYDSDAGNLVLHLNHLTPPAFAVQPTNESVVISNIASFSATLTGALPMSFQWSFNGTPLVDDGVHITGSATASLSIANITTADAGSYALAATNFLGSTNSTAAVLNVLTPPTFTTQPVGRSVPPGLPTIFNAAATGNPMPGYYQWQLNGTNIPGATSSSYTNLAVGTNDLGFYQVIASNSVASAVSASVQLTFGLVAAWGLNTSGECLPPPGLSNVVAIAGNLGASFAVRNDGTIIPWGSGTVISVPASASNIVAIATSDNSANFVLRSDGTVVGWPNFYSGQAVFSNIVSIAAGYGFVYGLRAEGTLTSLYFGNNIVRLPAGLNHITAIACGYSGALALRSDGTVVVAGTDGTTNPPAGLNNVVAIAAGYSYAMALKSNGTVVAWGSGTGTNLPAGLTNIVAISAGNYFGENSGMAVRADGTLLTWGDNNYGDKNPPAALSNLVSIAAAAPAFHGLALVNNGGPVILQPPVGLTANAGRSVTLQGSAVGAQPLSYQWLLNGTNVPGATSPSLVISNVQLGSVGNYQLFVSNSINTALSLSAPLTVISNSALTFLSAPAGQTNYQGSKVTLGAAVLGSGPVSYQWYYSTNIQNNFTAVPGANSDSLVFDPALAGQSGYYRVVASNQFSSVTSPSTYERVLFAKAWGYLPTDPSIIVTNAAAIAVGNQGLGNPYGPYLVLKSDGTISSWGLTTFGQTNFSALSSSIVTAIAAGYGESLALKSDGTVYAVGFGVYGETNVPAGLSGVTAIACGDYHDLALKFDGTIVGWGQNTYSQATNVAYIPGYGYIPVTNVVALAAGGPNSVALHADGSVVTWGQYGSEYTVPPNATNVIAVAAGGTHFLALRANGTVVGWGSSPYGQATIPATWSNIVAISAAANHSVALRNDGTILTLGNYYNGPTLTIGSVPTDLANVVAIASSGDHDLGLFGTRSPAFTVQPWDRAIPSSTTTNIVLAAKCAGVQPVRYQWQLNGTNVPSATNDTLVLTNQPNRTAPIILIPNGAYQLIASNAYGVAASQYAKVTTFIPLGTALNTPLDAKNGYLYNWTTGGNALWFGETNVTHDGVSAAQSGGIGALQQTILQTTVGTNWPGSYTFWWNVSSEQDFDILEFRINGIVQTSISGSPGWAQVSIPVAAGTNVLMWRYYKDATIDVGLDAGWVDQFAFIPAPPQMTVQPVSQIVNVGTNVTFSVVASGGPDPRLFYQWWQNGNMISVGGPVLNLNNVGRAQNGTYFVTVTNSYGSTVSSNAVLQVLVPQLLASPQLLPNGTFQLLSTDANGGLLSPSDLPNFAAQASTDLVNWVTLPNALSLTNGMLLLQDSGSSNYTTRYYRIIEQ
jgi:alpha-tubulin suppressor-like RCC1 family protein